MTADPYNTALFKVRDATAARELRDHLGDVINVKSMGAAGNGTTDDTAAIQAAFDLAYGTYAAPHGGLNDVGSLIYTNRPVFFPVGHYKVSSAIASRAISGAANNGSGLIRLTVSTTGLTTGDNVHVVGVTGTTEANFPWFVTVIDATHLDLQMSAFANAYVSGGTITTPCLRLKSTQGALITGGGRMGTFIESASPNAAVVCTNGCAYSRFENLTFAADANGIAFQLDWANSDTGTCALQSNTFHNVTFGGIGGHTAPKYGLMIGAGQDMGSETMVLNCYTGGCSVAGISTWNYNACDNTIVGGNIASCAIGILVTSGSFNTINGVSFQAQTDCDIYVINGAQDSYSVAGCRSESANFFKQGAAQPVHISGCNQTLGTSGYFWSGSGYVTLDSCSSINGYVEGNPRLAITYCDFQRSDYLTAGADNFTHLQVTPQRVTTQTAATYSVQGYDCSSKILFDRATGQTVTVPKTSDNTIRLVAGSKIEVQQVNTGQTVFAGASGVTVRSANGLKLRAQYSCATLTCDGSDLWTLSGDTAV